MRRSGPIIGIFVGRAINIMHVNGQGDGVKLAAAVEAEVLIIVDIGVAQIWKAQQPAKQTIGGGEQYLTGGHPW